MTEDNVSYEITPSGTRYPQKYYLIGIRVKNNILYHYRLVRANNINQAIRKLANKLRQENVEVDEGFTVNLTIE